MVVGTSLVSVCEQYLEYLTLMREDAPQRSYSMRDLFNAILYVIRTGMQWRMMPRSEQRNRRAATRSNGRLKR